MIYRENHPYIVPWSRCVLGYKDSRSYLEKVEGKILSLYVCQLKEIDGTVKPRLFAIVSVGFIV